MADPSRDPSRGKKRHYEEIFQAVEKNRGPITNALDFRAELLRLAAAYHQVKERDSQEASVGTKKRGRPKKKREPIEPLFDQATLNAVEGLLRTFMPETATVSHDSSHISPHQTSTKIKRKLTLSMWDGVSSDPNLMQTGFESVNHGGAAVWLPEEIDLVVEIMKTENDWNAVRSALSQRKWYLVVRKMTKLGLYKLDYTKSADVEEAQGIADRFREKFQKSKSSRTLEEGTSKLSVREAKRPKLEKSVKANRTKLSTQFYDGPATQKLCESPPPPSSPRAQNGHRSGTSQELSAEIIKRPPMKLNEPPSKHATRHLDGNAREGLQELATRYSELPHTDEHWEYSKSSPVASSQNTQMPVPNTNQSENGNELPPGQPSLPVALPQPQAPSSEKPSNIKTSIPRLKRRRQETSSEDEDAKLARVALTMTSVNDYGIFDNKWVGSSQTSMEDSLSDGDSDELYVPSYPPNSLTETVADDTREKRTQEDESDRQDSSQEENELKPEAMAGTQIALDSQPMSPHSPPVKGQDTSIQRKSNRSAKQAARTSLDKATHETKTGSVRNVSVNRFGKAHVFERRSKRPSTDSLEAVSQSHPPGSPVTKDSIETQSLLPIRSSEMPREIKAPDDTEEDDKGKEPTDYKPEMIEGDELPTETSQERGLLQPARSNVPTSSYDNDDDDSEQEIQPTQAVEEDEDDDSSDDTYQLSSTYPYKKAWAFQDSSGALGGFGNDDVEILSNDEMGDGVLEDSY
ncbi:hypothetical protein BZG36_02380 [Bifiguratus adelaidae]|uniref:Uncharacterized protein n=1 Tax=Bifiguratus adelaidae TaxID=1938954 RepID=A0A261Y1G6_9FUNG|nr:hypothetical protein BZG36_02380 [Bifiguratus adelaidae]